MSERAAAAAGLAFHGSPTDAKIVLSQFEELSTTFHRTLDPNSDGLLSKYQVYRDEIKEIMDGDKYIGISRELLISVRTLLNNVPLLLKHEGMEQQNLKEALGVLSVNISLAEMKFRKWREETLTRINERRRSLGAGHSSLDSPSQVASVDVIDGGTF